MSKPEVVDENKALVDAGETNSSPTNELLSSASTTSSSSMEGRKFSSKGVTALFLIYSIVLLSVIGFGSNFYFQIKNDEDSLRQKLDTLQLRYIDLSQSTLAHQQEHVELDKRIVERINNTNVKIEFVDRVAETTFVTVFSQMAELANHSNTEVLHKLNTTQLQMTKALQGVKEIVATNLGDLSKNVTNMLALSDKTVKGLGARVAVQLNSTLLKMRGVAHEASIKIAEVQNNVTTQLSYMDQTLVHTRNELSTAVDEARAAIDREVQSVRDNIDQYVSVTNKQFAAENDFVKYQLAGTFTLLACLISLWHVTSHMRHYAKPDVQRRIMAVLWMVPIYSVTSWLSLVFPRLEYIFGGIRDIYEAYVVYTFIALLIAVLQDGQSQEEFMERLTKQVIEEGRAIAIAQRTKASNKPSRQIVPPCPCCYTPSRVSSVAAAWLNQCRLLAMQFVIMKPTLYVLPYIITLCGYDYQSPENSPLLDDGRHINWTSAKLYVVICMNASVALAFFGLLRFYHGTERELQWCDPWPKFLCIKGVVFMTFWQGLCIQAMASFGLVDERASSQIQSLLICIEMMIASIAHYYIFPFEEWQEGYQREHRKVSVLNDTLAVRDFVADFKRVVSRWESGIISEQEVAFDLEQSLQHNISVNNTPEKKGERGGGAVESSEGAALLSARSEDKSPWRTNRGYDDIRVDTLQWTSPQVDAGSGERTGLLSGRRSGGSAVNMPKISYGAWSDTVSPMVDSRKELDQQAGEENTSL